MDGMSRCFAPLGFAFALSVAFIAVALYFLSLAVFLETTEPSALLTVEPGDYGSTTEKAFFTAPEMADQDGSHYPNWWIYFLLMLHGNIILDNTVTQPFLLLLFVLAGKPQLANPLACGAGTASGDKYSVPESGNADGRGQLKVMAPRPR